MKVTKEDRLERIEKLIEQLRGCSDRETIARLGQIEHDWLFDNYPASSAGTFISSEYIPAIEQAFPLSDGDELVRNEIWQKVNGKLIKRHLVVETLKPTKEEWVERNQPVVESTVTRINSKLPLDPSPLIKKAESMLSSDSWAIVAAALIFLTGRRASEIAWCGKFSPSGEKKLLFNGQLKKGKIETEPFEIPTLIDAERVFQAYNRLRYLQQTKTKILRIPSAKEAASKTNNQINQAIRKHFSDDLQAPSDRKRKTKQLSAGNLRAAYGKIAAHFYCPEECEPILFVAKILGHQCENYSTESLATTIHYYTYRIVNVNKENEIATRVPDCKGTLEQVTNSEASDLREVFVSNSQVSERSLEQVTDSTVKDRNLDEVTNFPVNKGTLEKVSNSQVSDLREVFVSNSEVNDLREGEVSNSEVSKGPVVEVTDSQINKGNSEEVPSCRNDRNLDEVTNSQVSKGTKDEVTKERLNDRSFDEVTNSPVNKGTLEQVSSSEVSKGTKDEVTNSEVSDLREGEVTDSQINLRSFEQVTNSTVNDRPLEQVNDSQINLRSFEQVTNSTVNDRPLEELPDRKGDRTLEQVSNSEVKNQEEVSNSPCPLPPAPLPRRDDAISGTMLAARLGVQLPTVGRSRKKGEDRFLEWSGKLDPDGISWKFVKRGKLKSTGHDRNVDIYIPIGNLNISNKVTQIDPLPIKQGGLEVLNKLRLASQLNLGSSNPTEQLSNLLGWVENKLNEDETRERLYYQGNKEELLTTAIESLTEQVKRASDIIESNLLPIQEITSSQKPVPEQKAEELDPDTAPNPVVLAAKNSRSEKLARDDRTTKTLIRLETEELKSTIEALNTSIALKQSAIVKEKKKRSKANTDTIELWEKEIRSLKRSIEFLNSQ